MGESILKQGETEGTWHVIELRALEGEGCAVINSRNADVTFWMCIWSWQSLTATICEQQCIEKQGYMMQAGMYLSGSEDCNNLLLIISDRGHD